MDMDTKEFLIKLCRATSRFGSVLRGISIYERIVEDLKATIAELKREWTSEMVSSMQGYLQIAEEKLAEEERQWSVSIREIEVMRKLLEGETLEQIEANYAQQQEKMNELFDLVKVSQAAQQQWEEQGKKEPGH